MARNRGRLGALALIVLSGALTSCGQEEEPEQPVNVVLISIDTLRPDHLGVYGYDRDTSPRIDAIAKRAVVFDRAYSQSPKTGPSHMTMLTGLFPGAHGVRNLGEEPNVALSESIPTLAERLKEGGYKTAAFTAGGHVGADLGFDRGFDTFEAGGGVQKIFERAITEVNDRAKEEEPFFLFVHTYEVHDPYVPPEKYQRWNDPSYAGEIISTRRALKEAAGEEWQKQHEIFWDKVDPESAADIQRLKDLYDGSIALTDELVGALYDRLEKHGELENTLFVIVSDHGEEFSDHGGFLHESLYDELLHVPWIMQFPKGRGDAWNGKRIAAPVRMVDLMPTVLRTLDLALPEICEGADIRPLLSGKETPHPRPLFAEWPRAFMTSLQTDDWKLIQKESAETLDEELFNMATDPGETKSVLESESEIAQKVREAIQKVQGVNGNIHSSFQSGKGVEMSPDVMKELQRLGYIGQKGPKKKEKKEESSKKPK
ncbi:MAG: sulfatase [Planctomycetota bacterium]